MHKSQLLSLLLGAFVIGVMVGSFWTASRESILALILLGTMLLVIFGYFQKIRLQNRKIGFLVGFSIIVITVGIFRVNTFMAEHGILLEFDRQVGEKNVPISMWGYVDSDFVTANQGGQFILRVKDIVAVKKVIHLNERTLVLTGRFPEYKFGQAITLVGTPNHPVNFNNFDYTAYLRKEGIRTIVNNPEIIPGAPLDLGILEKLRIIIYSGIFGAKKRFESALRQSLVEPNAAFIDGLLLGTKNELPKSLKDDFAITGTSHIVAISGYNVALIAEMIMFILIFFMRRRSAIWVSVLAIGLFVVLTGASASVVRAAFMGLLVIFASGYGRLYNPGTSLLLAAAGMLMINPLALRYDLGFQLSFAAVLGLFYLSPVILYFLRKLSLPARFKELASNTMAAQISVLPLLLYYFHSLSLVALPVNLIILPLVPLAMLSGFVMGIGGLLSEYLGRFIGITAWAVTQFQLMIVREFAHLPWASIKIGISGIILFLLYLLGIITVIILRKSNV